MEDGKATFDVSWFNPRAGGSLQQGTVASIQGPGKQQLGKAPAETDKDWIILVTKGKR